MAKSKQTTNLLVRRENLTDARALLAAAGFVPLKEEDANATAVRLYFPMMGANDALRLMRAIPKEMHASAGVAPSQPLLDEIARASADSPDALKDLMERLAKEARSQA